MSERLVSACMLCARMPMQPGDSSQGRWVPLFFSSHTVADTVKDKSSTASAARHHQE